MATKEELLAELSKRRRLAELKAALVQKPQYKSESEIPVLGEEDLPFAPKQQQQDISIPIPTPFGTVDASTPIGLGETALSIGSAVTGGAFGYISGAGNQAVKEVVNGEFGSMEAADRIEKSAVDTSTQNTYAPRTDKGQKYTENVGEVAEALTPIAPQLAEFQMLKPKLPKVPKMTKRHTRKVIAQQIRDGNRDIVNIEKSLNQNGQLITNPKMKTAIKLLGNNDKARHIAILFEDMNGATKGQVGKMLDDIGNGRKFGDSYLMENRPVNRIGESLAARAKELNKIRSEANTQLNASLKYLKNKSVDISVPYSDFLASLKKEGISVFNNKKGKLAVNLDNATARLGDVLPKAELEKLLNQLRNGELPATTAHKLKRYVREFVSYDDGLQVGAKQSKGIETAIKDLSTGINEKLKATSKGYRKANEKYSTVADALAKTSKHLKGIDLESDFASSKLGSLSKRIGSNLASREQIMMLVDEMDSALKKNGITYKDDIKGQVSALGKIEEIFGVEAAQSPFSFQSRIAKAGQAAVNPKGAALDEVVGALQKMTQLDFNKKMAALRKLLEDKK